MNTKYEFFQKLLVIHCVMSEYYVILVQNDSLIYFIITYTVFAFDFASQKWNVFCSDYINMYINVHDILANLFKEIKEINCVQWNKM